MSKSSIKVEIEICSNCKSHQWCTRHNQASYSSLAMEVEKALKAHDSSIDVEIFQVGGQKMGSFEITCNGTLLFSKLQLGYFPHVPSATSRIISFIDDYRNGGDLKKYTEGKGVSPNKGLQSNGSGPFSPNSPSKGQGKRIKYNPDYKDPSREENTTPFLIHDRHEQPKENKADHEKHQQKPEKHANVEKHVQEKKQTKPKEQHNQSHAKKENHQPAKKTEPKHEDTHKNEPKVDDHKNKDQEHKQEVKKEKQPPKKTQEQKPKQESNETPHKEEKHEQKKHEQKKHQQKKAEAPKQNPEPETHKKDQKKQESPSNFILAQNQGEKSTPGAVQQKPKPEVLETVIIKKQVNQHQVKEPAPEKQAEVKQEDKYEEDFDNENDAKEKKEAQH